MGLGHLAVCTTHLCLQKQGGHHFCENEVSLIAACVKANRTWELCGKESTSSWRTARPSPSSWMPKGSFSKGKYLLVEESMTLLATTVLFFWRWCLGWTKLSADRRRKMEKCAHHLGIPQPTRLQDSSRRCQMSLFTWDSYQIISENESYQAIYYLFV